MDWKTTLPGLVAAGSLLAKHVLGFNIPDEVQQAIVTICLFVLSVFATSRGVNK
jgi:type III secretion system FlhB-like substrate exporter